MPAGHLDITVLATKNTGKKRERRGKGTLGGGAGLLWKKLVTAVFSGSRAHLSTTRRRGGWKRGRLLSPRLKRGRGMLIAFTVRGLKKKKKREKVSALAHRRKKKDRAFPFPRKEYSRPAVSARVRCGGEAEEKGRRENNKSRREREKKKKRTLSTNLFRSWKMPSTVKGPRTAPMRGRKKKKKG